MYVPKHFSQDDPALLLDVMRTNNFATLVSSVDGLPFATHLPVLATMENGVCRIEGHFAKANPQWKALESNPAALIMFHGPHTYISPALYRSKDRVPTWNYVAVHANGKVTIRHAATDKLSMLGKLVAHHEPAYKTQFEEIDGDLKDGLLQAIVAFEMTVETLEGKFKLGQNRLPDNQPGMQTWLENGGENEQSLADWMKRLGYWSK